MPSVLQCSFAVVNLTNYWHPRATCGNCIVWIMDLYWYHCDREVKQSKDFTKSAARPWWTQHSLSVTMAMTFENAHKRKMDPPAFSPLWWHFPVPGCRGEQPGWPPAAQGWGVATRLSCRFHHRHRRCLRGLCLTLHPQPSGDGTGGTREDSCPSPHSGSPRRSPGHPWAAESSAALTGSW